MLAMVRHLEVLLVAAAAGHTPLLFFVIVPSWSDAACFALMRDSPFLRGSSQLARKDHEYIDGLQHRAQRCTWGANVDSTWFVLATEEGSAAVPQHTGMPPPAQAVSWTPFASSPPRWIPRLACSSLQSTSPLLGCEHHVCLFVCLFLR